MVAKEPVLITTYALHGHPVTLELTPYSGCPHQGGDTQEDPPLV